MYRLRRAMNGFVLASLLVSLIGWRATPSNAAMATAPEVVDQRAVEVAAGGRILGLSPDGMRPVVKRETAICIQDAALLAETSCAAWDMGGVHQESFVWSLDSTKIACTEDAAPFLVDSDLWVLDTATGDLTNLTDDGECDDLVDAIANDAPFQAERAALAARQDTAQGTDGPTSGSIVGVTEAKVAIRDAPSTGAPIVLVVTGGTELEITGGVEEGDGFTWLPVRDPATETTGYVPEPFLSLPPGMSIEAIPTASPSPITADTSGSLQSMLARVPASLAPTAAGDRASYANIAAQLNAVGVEPRSGADEDGLDDWIPVISGLALPSSLGQHALNEQWRETFGFDVFQVDQTLQLGQPPDIVTMLRGNFDETELRAAWARNGYKDVDVEGTVVASLAPGPEIDFNSPVGRLAFGSMNNAVLLADGTLVFGANLDRIEAILAVEAGDAPSLAEDPSFADLLASAPEELATGLLIPGEALHTADADVVNQIVGRLTDEEIDALATEIASTGDQSEAMPPVRLALLGITGGGSLSAANADDAGGPDQSDQPEARIVIALLMANRAAAEQAAAVVLSRLEDGVSSDTSEPYAQFFPERSAEAAPEGPVVLVTLTTGERPARVIFEMYYRRDLGFLAW